VQPISFPYSAIPIPASAPFPNGQVVHRPLLVAKLVARNGKELNCIVHVDSGADHCVFPVSFASALGLDTLKMKMHLTGGVGSTANTTYYEHLDIEIHFGGVPGISMISFGTYAGFTAGLEAQGMGPLGQQGFFETFAVHFDHKAKQFTIFA
jgi:hypothetical protein